MAARTDARTGGLTSLPERLSTLATALRELPFGASPDLFFGTLADFVPFEAALVDRFSEREPAHGSLVPFGLSPALVDQMMCARAGAGPAFRLLASIAPGSTIRTSQLRPLIEWSKIRSHRLLVEAGFPDPAGLKLDSKPHGLDREHSYLGLFRRGDQPPLSPLEQALLSQGWRDIAETVARLRVSLLAGEPLLVQMAAEKELGLALENELGALREANARAHELASEYGADCAVRRCSDLTTLLGELRAQQHADRRGATVQLVHSREARVLRATCHRVVTGPHGNFAGCRLWVLEDDAIRVIDARLLRLSPRLQEVARGLVLTALTARDLAALFGVTRATAEKQIVQLYRELGVDSRPGLVELLMGSRLLASPARAEDRPKRSTASKTGAR